MTYLVKEAKSLSQPVKCKRCGHEWTYTGSKSISPYPVYISCPMCRTNIRLPPLPEPEPVVTSEIKDWLDVANLESTLESTIELLKDVAILDQYGNVKGRVNKMVPKLKKMLKAIRKHKPITEVSYEQHVAELTKQLQR